jgi:hypothetical protein
MCACLTWFSDNPTDSDSFACQLDLIGGPVVSRRQSTVQWRLQVFSAFHEKRDFRKLEIAGKATHSDKNFSGPGAGGNERNEPRGSEGASFRLRGLPSPAEALPTRINRIETALLYDMMHA